MRQIAFTLLLISLCSIQTSQAEGAARFPSSSAPLVNITPSIKVDKPPIFEHPSLRPPHQPLPPRQIDNRPRFPPPHEHYSRGRDSGWQVHYRAPFPSWAFYYDLTPPSNTTTIIYATPNNHPNNNITSTEEISSHISPLEKSIVAQWAYREPSLYNIIPSRKLEQGWEKSLQRGYLLSDATFSYAQALPPTVMQQMPNGPAGTLLITLQGRLLRVDLRTQTVIDVYDLPNN
jgi:hypothetical protein